jgi:cyclopropane-fatty-acyl-phospholipid synthase
MLRQKLLARMHDLREARLVIDDASGTQLLGRAAQTAQQTLHARIRVHDPAFYRLTALNGSVGAGEAYRDGMWDCDDLVALIRMLVRNRDLLDALETGSARLGGALMKIWHALSRNTLARSRRNIAAHYDLGNELFGLFLDDNLMYSSAVYESEHDSLDVASTRKLDRICRKLALNANDHVVEIGTGWGGFALHAAKYTGCRVTTTTISAEQYELARERVAAAGLTDRVHVLLEDYRNLSGQYNKLASIEMIEAIGHQYLDTYFRKVGSLLRDDGAALIQAITIEDHRYTQALNAVDFIKRHIFPGSFIPSISVMLASLARTTDLKLFNLEDIGASYALTLKAWRERFLARRADVLALGLPERFVRMWEFYFAYCEGGFRERSIGTAQMLLTRPRSNLAQFTPRLD